MFQGGVVLVFVDDAFFIHHAQNKVFSLVAFFKIIYRIIFGRAFDNPREHSAFGVIQQAKFFAEKSLCGIFYPVFSASEIEHIEIHGQYLVFCIFSFQFKRKPRLAQLTPETFFARKMSIFDELLRDRRRAFFERSRSQIV